MSASFVGNHLTGLRKSWNIKYNFNKKGKQMISFNACDDIFYFHIDMADCRYERLVEATKTLIELQMKEMH